jgi:hypothetical protein
MWPLGAAKMRLVQLADHAVPAFDNTPPFDPSTLPSVLLSTAHAGTSTSTHPAAAAECRKRHRASQLRSVSCGGRRSAGSRAMLQRRASAFVRCGFDLHCRLLDRSATDLCSSASCAHSQARSFPSQTHGTRRRRPAGARRAARQLPRRARLRTPTQGRAGCACMCAIKPMPAPASGKTCTASA